MRIALINENSQAPKNELICSTLKKVVEPMGHTVDNYGMYSGTDKEWLTYVQNGILGAVLLNSGAGRLCYHRLRNRRGSDAFPQQLPRVLCGHVVDPSDAYMFAQINDGNAISLPFAKGFGLGRRV